MGKIRVCNVDEEGRFGGPEGRIVKIAKALKDSDIQTHVVYPKMDSHRFEKELSCAGVENTKLDITRLSKEPKILIRYIFRFIYEIFLLSGFFIRNKFDLIHVNGAYQFKTAIAGKCAGIPVVWHLNNNTFVNPLVKRVFDVISPVCSNGFILAGQRVYDFYLKNSKLKKKVHMEIHAPVDTGLYDPELFDPGFEDVRSSDLQSYTIVTVSGINPRKGLEYFAETAAKVNKHFSNVKFLIAGSYLTSQKEYAESLFRLVSDLGLYKDTFRFVGHINDVVNFLFSADICVFTSLEEASPTAVWEAMSMGKPVVTTDVGAVGQFIQNGYSGYIVPPKDADKLCSKVVRLLKDPVLRNAMGERARKVAIEKLDVRIAAENHSNIYKKVLKLA